MKICRENNLFHIFPTYEERKPLGHNATFCAYIHGFRRGVVAGEGPATFHPKKGSAVGQIEPAAPAGVDNTTTKYADHSVQLLLMLMQFSGFPGLNGTASAFGYLGRFQR